MMSVTIDPSETRRPAAAPRPSRVNLRVVLLSGLGVLGLAGFAAIASTTLGSLAGPQFTRPTLAKATAAGSGLGNSASDWPDLRDGVPALAPAAPKTVAAAPEGAAVPVAAAKAELLPAAIAPPVVQVARGAAATPTDVKVPEAKPTETLAETPAQKPAVLAAAPKPPRLPQIENASVLPPARPASLVPATRTAALIAPLPNETTRSRATGGTFTALTPEREPEKRKPVVSAAHARPALAKAAAKPPAAAAAAAQVAQAEPEPEQTEFLGVKVPSFAPAGRKIAESVEALGNAVKSLPDHF
ncbi:hypothetical protein ASF49_11375 [Methylobacterium sp. Leaf104]|nr:hypothetical protein ASF49_11375 [Methylobacterium sp. Leaf104]